MKVSPQDPDSAVAVSIRPQRHPPLRQGFSSGLRNPLQMSQASNLPIQHTSWCHTAGALAPCFQSACGTSGRVSGPAGLRARPANHYFNMKARALGTVGFGLLISAALVPTAPAHDHKVPPPPVLSVGKAEQVGRKIHSLWLQRVNDRQCDLVHNFGFVRFPKESLRVAPPGIATIRLQKKAVPLEWWVYAWSAVKPNGQPKGPKQVLPTSIEPRLENTEVVAWNLKFVLPPTQRQLFLLAEVYWADEEGCSPTPDLGDQSAAWSYRVKPR